VILEFARTHALVLISEDTDFGDRSCCDAPAVIHQGAGFDSCMSRTQRGRRIPTAHLRRSEPAHRDPHGGGSRAGMGADAPRAGGLAATTYRGVAQCARGWGHQEPQDPPDAGPAATSVEALKAHRARQAPNGRQRGSCGMRPVSCSPPRPGPRWTRPTCGGLGTPAPWLPRLCTARNCARCWSTERR